MYEAERPTKILSSVNRGIMREWEFYMHLVLDAEEHPPSEIWAAIPEHAKDGFKKWILSNALNDDLEYLTNNFTVKPIVQVRAFRDFIEGRTRGDAPVKGAVRNIWGTR